MAVNKRFRRTLHAAREEVCRAGHDVQAAGVQAADLQPADEPGAGTASGSAATLLYRRAVPTDARAGLAPPPLPVPGLRFASNGVAVLVPEDFPGGRVTPETVDAALHAARAAGLNWAAVWVASDEDRVVLRALEFVAFDADA